MKTNNNHHSRGRSPLLRILSEKLRVSGDRAAITVFVASQSDARRISAAPEFHDRIKELCDSQGVPLGSWEIVSSDGSRVYDRYPKISPSDARAILREFSTTHSEVKAIMSSIINSIAPQISDDLLRVISESPGASDELGRMLAFCLGTEMPSVLTYHPTEKRRKTDHCFLMANSYLNTEVEALTSEDLARNPNFTEPIILDGRMIDPHWSYEPHRLEDLIRQLRQTGEYRDFVYRWKNPRGQIVIGCLDYKVFQVGDLAFRASHHKDLQIL